VEHVNAYEQLARQRPERAQTHALPRVSRAAPPYENLEWGVRPPGVFLTPELLTQSRSPLYNPKRAPELAAPLQPALNCLESVR